MNQPAFNLSTEPLGEETADLHASSDEYAARFRGEIGRWMLSVQENITLQYLDQQDMTVLDVGGGHGQVALPLMRAHRSVTVLGSSPACSSRLKEFVDNGMISFQVGSLIDLPFADKSFDTVVCFRLLSHCTQWRRLIKEMCRVARHSVIVDYPVWTSVNVLSPLMFRLKKRIEGNTRAFELFSNPQIKREFKSSGFGCEGIRSQFFFPMAVHRVMKSVPMSQTLESVARGTGLTWTLGSPVIAKMVRSDKAI